MLVTVLVLAGVAHALVPRACTYSVTAQVGSTCDSIASDWGITVDDLKAWNPSIKDCSKLTAGATYCIEWSGPLPGQTSTATSTSSTTPPTKTTTQPPTTTTAPSGPSPTQDGIIKTCNKWHKVVKGEICQSVVDKEQISLDQFYQWNPAIGTDCQGLWLGYYVCVGVSGGSGTTTVKPTSTTSSPPAIKTQPGVVSDCKKFHQVAQGDGCWAVENKYGITDDDFRKWNPMLDESCSNLWLGYSVCVGV
ncbi:hypothetical protein QBC47DRAFT_439725 [Echria macrotheca]|uniref:LysM domain-containing protein n=1 Tax=Echria macrotheca TaxID=438768 RepID=A0AAJ0B3W9_9PEZI|nr:hypothetical protein QBC47DRAFT_439725 [Echria macrotheca]